MPDQVTCGSVYTWQRTVTIDGEVESLDSVSVCFGAPLLSRSFPPAVEVALVQVSGNIYSAENPESTFNRPGVWQVWTKAVIDGEPVYYREADITVEPSPAARR